MEKAEFSETQFVIGFTRELFSSYNLPFTIWSPSTRDEKHYASDLIVEKFNARGNYRFSEFYQFKRSKYFNSEVFDSLTGGITIDTSLTPMYGFNIYNSRATRQFNVLQKLAQKPRCRVYYCAPLFHTINEFNWYFRNSSIQNNSKVFHLDQTQLQNVRIPLNTNHKIVFDRTSQYICSDPLEIEGYLASERDSSYNSQESGNYLEDFIKDLYELVTSEIENNERNKGFEDPPVNLFEVKEMLLNYFDIHWLIK